MPMTRRTMILGMLGSSVNAASAMASGVQIDGGFAFGSSWRITTEDSAELARIRPMIEAIIAEVDSQMSPYRAESYLSAFNLARAQVWHPMPSALCHVATQALHIANLTDGAFDPTVGPTVSRYGFGPIKGRSGHFSGIDVTTMALRKTVPHLTLDLCGIAKGYALDRIAGALSRAGVANALVEIGGEVKALGRHPSGRPWNVAIADPTAIGFRTLRIITPGRYALATSGHAANGLRGPLRTSHIIDPHHGKPASTVLLSVSVLAATATQADAFATAFCAAGPEAGVALARRLKVTALFVMEGTRKPYEVTTGHFASHILV